MQAPAIEPIQGEVAPVRDAASRLINPIFGYGLALVFSIGFWAVLFKLIF